MHHTPPIIVHTKNYIHKHGIVFLCRSTGSDRTVIERLLSKRQAPYRTLKSLYKFFGIPIDNFFVKTLFFHNNFKRKKQNELGEIFRLLRLKSGLSRADASRAMKLSEDTISGIEQWHHLPQLSGYTLKTMLATYHTDARTSEAIYGYIRSVRCFRRMLADIGRNIK